MPRRATQRAVSASLIVSALLMSAGMSACGKSDTAASLMSDAQQYENKGDTKAALIQLKNAASKAPADGEIRMRLAALYIMTGDPVSAEKEARKAMELKIPDARTVPLLTRALVQQHQPEKALQASAAMAESKDAGLLAARGDAYLMLNQADKARAAYQAALALAAGQSEALIGMARLSAMDKDFATASKLTDDAIAANPKDGNTYLFRGNLLRAQNKGDEAITAFGQAVAVRPDMGAAYLERANLYIDAKKFDLAKADIDAARKLTPNSLTVVYSQAVLDFSQNNFSAANDGIQKILSKAPDNMPALLLAGAIELNMGSFKSAEGHLNAYLSANPGNVYARKLLVQSQLRSAQPGLAGATLAPVLDSGKDDAQIMALAGETSLRNRDFGKATQYFEKAAALQPQASSVHTSLGLAQLAQGNKEQGIAELEKATALDPKSEIAGAALIRSELAMQHYDKAIAVAKAQIAVHPDNADLYNLAGGAYMAKGDEPSARTSFEKAASLKSDLLGPVMNLAQLDMAAKKPEAAKARLVAFAAKNKGAAAPTALAALAMSQKNVDEATMWLEKAAADNPDDLKAASQLINHYLRSGQAPKALNMARKMQAANPTSPELLDALGQAQLANKDNAGALESYGKLAGMMPKSAGVQLRLAAVHLRLNNKAAAAEDLKKALALEPSNERALAGQIELAMAANKPDEALALTRALQKSAPKSPLGSIFEGDILMSQKKYDAAANAYSNGFALMPGTPTLIKTAAALNASGKSKEAEAKITTWLGAHPDDGTATLFLTELLSARKDYKGASDRLEALLKGAPNDSMLLNNLAWVYQQQKDPRAAATAERALKAAPESPAVLDTAGWIYVDNGDAAKGLPLLQKAVTLQPASRELRYHLATALAKTGDKAGARKLLEQVISGTGPFAHGDEARALLKTL